MRATRYPIASPVLFALAALAMTLSALALSQLAASAQGEMIDFRVAKYTCQSDPGNISPAADNAPEDCDLTTGVSFTIEAEGLDAPLTCTTDGTGICIVQVPNEANVTVTEDTSTAPDGYAPRQNPIETQAVTEFAGAVFVNLPIELPDTGTGVTPSGTATSSATALAVLAVILLLTGAMIRRPAFARR
jgi:hypothetical protein